jgi:hypothetical protein
MDEETLATHARAEVDPEEVRTADGPRKTEAVGRGVDVIVGEIPDAEDLSHMLWTTRCDEHGLLGTFEDRDSARDLQQQHVVEHGPE